MKLLLLVITLTFLHPSYGQDSLSNAFSWSIFLEAYYSYDFNRPGNHEKANFLYNHDRHNEFNINLAMAGVSYQKEKVRANFALMAGTYADKNLASEPALLRNIYQANIGIQLLRNKNVWIDAGIFPSHIAFESAIAKECWTLTRSLPAESSPYYESGAKATYSPGNGRWILSAMVLNGWQKIKRPKGNNTLATGTQLTFTPSPTLSLNSGTFIGNDKPDSIRKWRYFHNFYSVLQFCKELQITIGLDYGIEQKEKSASKFNTWYSPILILRYRKNLSAIAARLEYFGDKTGVIIPLVNNKPFQMQGYSLNYDRKIGNCGVFRLETRLLKNSSPYFHSGSGFTSSQFSITTSLLFYLHTSPNENRK